MAVNQNDWGKESAEKGGVEVFYLDWLEGPSKITFELKPYKSLGKDISSRRTASTRILGWKNILPVCLSTANWGESRDSGKEGRGTPCRPAGCS